MQQKNEYKEGAFHKIKEGMHPSFFVSYHSDTLHFLIAENRLIPPKVHARGFQTLKKSYFALIINPISRNLTLGNLRNSSPNCLLSSQNQPFPSSYLTKSTKKCPNYPWVVGKLPVEGCLFTYGRSNVLPRKKQCYASKHGMLCFGRLFFGLFENYWAGFSKMLCY